MLPQLATLDGERLKAGGGGAAALEGAGKGVFRLVAKGIRLNILFFSTTLHCVSRATTCVYVSSRFAHN